MKPYEAMGAAIGRLVAAKQLQYGDSFGTAPQMLAVLYPNGVRVDQYGDLLTVVRVLDKLKRVATRHATDLESPWEDIAGYALLALASGHPDPPPDGDMATGNGIPAAIGGERCAVIR